MERSDKVNWYVVLGVIVVIIIIWLLIYFLVIKKDSKEETPLYNSNLVFEQYAIINDDDYQNSYIIGKTSDNVWYEIVKIGKLSEVVGEVNKMLFFSNDEELAYYDNDSKNIVSKFKYDGDRIKKPKLINDELVYLAVDNSGNNLEPTSSLYSLALDSISLNESQKIFENVNNYEVFNNEIYYINNLDSSLYNKTNKILSNVLDFKIEDKNIIYFSNNFELKTYSMLDKIDKTIIKYDANMFVYDINNVAHIKNDTLYYIKDNSIVDNKGSVLYTNTDNNDRIIGFNFLSDKLLETIYAKSANKLVEDNKITNKNSVEIIFKDNTKKSYKYNQFNYFE